MSSPTDAEYILNKFEYMDPSIAYNFNKSLGYYKNSTDEKVQDACKIFFVKHLCCLRDERIKFQKKITSESDFLPDYISEFASKIKELEIDPSDLITEFGEKAGLERSAIYRLRLSVYPRQVRKKLEF